MAACISHQIGLSLGLTDNRMRWCGSWWKGERAVCQKNFSRTSANWHRNARTIPLPLVSSSIIIDFWMGRFGPRWPSAYEKVHWNQHRFDINWIGFVVINGGGVNEIWHAVWDDWRQLDEINQIRLVIWNSNWVGPSRILLVGWEINGIGLSMTKLIMFERQRVWFSLFAKSWLS